MTTSTSADVRHRTDSASDADPRNDHPAPSSGPAARPSRRATSTIAGFLFASRWLQAPLYFGLIVAQVCYVFTFMKELWHIISALPSLTESAMMLMVLGLVDVVMVANLLIMVIVGGYETFVSKIRLDDHPDQPEWLSHVNANVLKVKLAMAIIGISSVHLLKTFVEAKSYYSTMGDQATSLLVMQTAIHLAFIVSAMGLAWIDKIGSHRSAPGPRMGAQGSAAPACASCSSH